MTEAYQSLAVMMTLEKKLGMLYTEKWNKNNKAVISVLGSDFNKSSSQTLKIENTHQVMCSISLPGQDILTYLQVTWKKSHFSWLIL